jgi:hypothetical protein
MSSVTLQFDKPRTLKFDLRAIKDLEANMGGMPLGTVVQQLSMIGVTAITMALWAGLKHEDKSLTPNLVTKMLEAYIGAGGSLRALGRALNDAIEATGLFNSDEDGEGNALTATRTEASAT